MRVLARLAMTRKVFGDGNDPRVPLLLAIVSYWLVGFTSACILGFRTELGAVGVWIGLSCGTLVYAILLILRFRKLAARFAA